MAVSSRLSVSFSFRYQAYSFTGHAGHQSRDEFIRSCVQPFFQKLHSNNTKYEDVLELGARIRDFPQPVEFQSDSFNVSVDSQPASL